MQILTRTATLADERPLRHIAIVGNGGDKRRGAAGSDRGRTLFITALLATALLTSALFAPSALAAVAAETEFVLNTFSFLIWGALVMWMCAGFTMLEAGSVRTKNASVICMKNIGLYSIAGITYYLVGYNLMYVDVNGWIGSLDLFYQSSADEIALLDGDETAAAAVIDSGYSTMSDWLFQMVFVATTASIVSGALAERVKLYSFLVFTIVLTTVIYPVVGAWTWGGGWLSEMGFQDFAGSTIVHSTGGWAALAGALVVGPRLGKFRQDDSIKSTPPSNIPAVTLGVFILWFGWFGFNCGSQLALGGASDAVAMSNVLVNTNLGAAGGVLAAIFVSRPILGRVDLLAVLNGAIAGLVSITAGPDLVDHYWAVLIGAVGGAICVFGIKFLEVVKVDDVVSAIPAHLFAGIWGTLAVCIAGGGNFIVQLTGIIAIGVFVFVFSGAAWIILNKMLGARVTPVVEELGQDTAELGIESYPEFMLMPDQDDIDELRGN
ncbi:MAG: ammonium transporter [bacterium]